MPSAVFKEIRSRIEASIKAGLPVNLEDALKVVPGAGDLISSVTGGPLSVAGASLAVEESQIVVRGTATLLGAPLAIVVTIRDEGGLVLTIEGTWSAPRDVGSLFGGRIHIPAGLASMSVSTVSITVHFATRTATLVLASSSEMIIGGLLHIREPKLSISMTGTGRARPSFSVEFEGTLMVGDVPLTLKATAGGGHSTFTVTPPAGGQGPTVQQVLKQFLGSIIPSLPDLPVTLDVNGDLETNTYTVTASLSRPLSVPIGVAPLSLTDAVVTIRKTSAGVEARLSAKASLGGQPIALEARLPGELILSGDLPSLDLAAILAVAGAALPRGVPAIQLARPHVIIRLSRDNPVLEIDATSDRFGSIMAVVARIGGAWQAVVIFSLPPAWKLSDLSPIFAPLDVLTIRDARLVFSTVSSDHLMLPTASGSPRELSVHRGISVDAKLETEGGVLSTIASWFHVKELPLHLTFEGDPGAAQVTATLDGPRTLIPGVLTLKGLELKIQPRPLAITLHGEVEMVIQGTVLPRFTIDVGLGGGGAPSLTFMTKDPWKNPFGIAGLTLTKVALSVQGEPVPRYAVLGIVTIGGREITMAAELTGGEPSALIGSFPGKISLRDVVRDLVHVRLPPVLDLSIEDLQIEIVPNPAGVTIGGIHFEHGLTVRGKLTTPDLTILANVHYVSPTSFHVAGTFSSGIRATIPITGLGNIVLDTTVAGTLDVELNGDQFKLVAGGDFTFLGKTLHIPTLTLNVAPSSLGELPRILTGLIVQQAQEVFGSILTDAAKWVQAIGAGAITGVSDVAGVLRHRFGKDAAFIAGQLKGLGKSAEEVANALKALNEPRDVVNRALVAAAYPAAAINDAMKHVFPGLPHVDTPAGPHGDHGVIPHLDTPGGPHFDTPHVDTHVDKGSSPFHLDFGTNVPHGDRSAPHVDTPSQAHVDTHVPPHVDTGSRDVEDHALAAAANLHIDTPAGPHVDHAVVPHLDTPGGPHVDTPHVDTHVDRAGPFHVDFITNVPHVDRSVPPHVDTPSQAHVDTNVPPHVDTP